MHIKTELIDSLKSILEGSSLLTRALHCVLFDKYLNVELRISFFNLFGYEHCRGIISKIESECKQNYAEHSRIMDSMPSIKRELELYYAQNESNNNQNHLFTYCIISALQSAHQSLQAASNFEKAATIMLEKDHYLKTENDIEKYVSRMYQGYDEFIAIFDGVCLKYGIDIDDMDLFKGAFCANNRDERDVSKVKEQLGGDYTYDKLLLFTQSQEDALESLAEPKRYEEVDLFKYVKQRTDDFDSDATSHFKNDVEGYFDMAFLRELVINLRTEYLTDLEKIELETQKAKDDFDNYVRRGQVSDNRHFRELLNRFYNYKTIIDIIHKKFPPQTVEQVEQGKKTTKKEEKKFEDYLYCDLETKEKIVHILTRENLKPKQLAIRLLAINQCGYIHLSDNDRGRMIAAFHAQYKDCIGYKSTVKSLQNCIDSHMGNLSPNGGVRSNSKITQSDIDVIKKELE